MAGRRLIDAAKLFNASKSIAQQHIKLRSQQLDVYSKTSTLAKAAKSQTDRITLTVEAARALSKRLNEDLPQYAQAAAQRATDTQNADHPIKETAREERPREDTKGGLKQDHHYDQSRQNTKAEPPAEEELDVQQEKAKRRPLPDGTIPSAGLALEGDSKGQDTFSERPASEPPKQPLAETQQGEGQKKEEGLKPVESKASTIPMPGQPAGTFKAWRFQPEPQVIPSHTNEPHRPDVPPQVQKLQEGHDRDVFYTRSVESKPPPPSAPREQIPRISEDAQESDDHVPDQQLNPDVYYAAPEPGQEQIQKEELPHQVAVPEQDALPEGMNTDVFRTKRVAKMLMGNPYKQKDHLELKGAAGTPYDHTRTAAGHDQDTFNVRRGEQTKPSAPEPAVQEAQSATTEKEMHDFASQLAKGADSAPSSVSEVRPISTSSALKHADMLTASP